MDDDNGPSTSQADENVTRVHNSLYSDRLMSVRLLGERSENRFT